MERGRIIVITGPPGTGKSTVSAIVAKESCMEKSVHMHTDDFYHYEESSYEMIGERTNKHYKLGQKVKVIVADTDKIMRTIDFRVVRDDVEPDEAVKDEASVLSKRTD